MNASIARWRMFRQQRMVCESGLFFVRKTICRRCVDGAFAELLFSCMRVALSWPNVVTGSHLKLPDWSSLSAVQLRLISPFDHISAF
jgi:hypothetical protein